MIKRSTLTANFTVINNRVLENTKLSLKAKGLWAFVMSKPDGWQVSIRGLAAQLSDGETSIRSALKELETAGLYRKERRQDEHGKITWDDEMLDSPCVENPHMDKPRVEKARQVNTNEAITEQVNTEENGTIVPLPVAEIYGKSEINELFGYWRDKTGVPISARRQPNRNACNNLLKKYGHEKVCQLIDGVALAQDDRYAPRISDFCDLQAKLTQLLTWGKKQRKGSVYVV